jgi:hypothetical protein
LNNDGYTVERLIHGLHAPYNKVAIWDYGGLAKVFGPGLPSKYHGPIKTCEQLSSLFADPNFGKGGVFEVRSHANFGYEMLSLTCVHSWLSWFLGPQMRR